MTRSLRTHLLTWVLVPLFVAVCVDTWLTYKSAVDTASIVQDQLLLGSARMIAEQIRFEDGSFQHQIPPAALELFQSLEPDRIFYRVTTETGQLLAGYASLPVPKIRVPADYPYFFAATMQGQPVRVVAFLQPVVGNPSLLPVIVEVAQTTHAHGQLADKLWLHALAMQLWILVLASVFILFGLHRGLRPVIRLGNDVRSRAEGTLKPLHTQQIPLELKPLVDAINDYVQRLENHTQRRSSFIQNAAHQLRTPLAVLSTQISDAIRSKNSLHRDTALLEARRTLQQTVHTVNQFLTLSSAEVDEPVQSHLAFEVFCSVVQKVVENLAVQAHSKGLDLGLDIQATPVTVYADAMALREIVVNLLDNAIRYTQTQGIVTVRIHRTENGLALIVEDNGPGIPLACHEQVFHRFFRMPGAESTGSGLGLSIVRELASKCSASVCLMANASVGSGLTVRIDFHAV